MQQAWRLSDSNLPLRPRAFQCRYALSALFLVPAKLAALSAAFAVQVVHGTTQSAEEICTALSHGWFTFLQVKFQFSPPTLYSIQVWRALWVFSDLIASSLLLGRDRRLRVQEPFVILKIHHLVVSKTYAETYPPGNKLKFSFGPAPPPFPQKQC